MALTGLTLSGTGNFNEKTAKLYSDFMLMTAHPGIGEDANLFFRNLSLGNLRGDYRAGASSDHGPMRARQCDGAEMAGRAVHGPYHAHHDQYRYPGG